jgi:hypothetical protein
MTDALVKQIQMEAEELRNVPKIPLREFYSWQMGRCEKCGQVVPREELTEFDRGRKQCKAHHA